MKPNWQCRPSRQGLCKSNQGDKDAEGHKVRKFAVRRTVRTAAATITAPRIKPVSRLPGSATGTATTISNPPVR